MKRKMMLVMLALLMLWAFSAHAQVIWHGPGDVTVSSCVLQDEDWLFLPSGTDPAQLELTVNGERTRIDWTQHSHESDVIPGVLSSVLPQTGKTLHVFVSQNLRSLHLFSDDPMQHGRLWLENCRLHENETTGSITMLRPDGSISAQMRLDQLRGRGNSTWRNVEYKSPYQFKLEYKADLLETGIEAERCRTWTLLTNERDPTLLRNQIALDLAKELKLSSASACEQVDLYYDGDYRGVYLLAEKVEVSENSINIRDFDKLLKPVNKKLGVSDPSDLPSPTNYTSEDPQADAYNSYGYDYGYADGVYDNQDVHAGGYLLELESRGTLTDHAWFRLSADRFIALKTPEYAGPTMVKSISELFLYAYEAMLNYGYHPVTGQSLEELIDIDSFTRSHLVAELFYNATLYSWSSTFFVIPEGESRIYAGPVWDFDNAFASFEPSLRANNDFSNSFYRTTVFQRAAKQIMQNEVRPVYEDVLFGETHGQHLKPFQEYVENIRKGWLMNYCRHQSQRLGFLNVLPSFEYEMETLASHLQAQYSFLHDEIAAWGEDEPTHEIELVFLLPYGNAHTAELTEVLDEPHGSLFLEDTQFVCLQPATEEEFGIWQTTFTFRAKPNCTIPDDVVIWLNGEPFNGEHRGDRLTLSVSYEDLYYRPAILDGVDYGPVFDYDYYIDSYPELLENYGDDREAVLRYFRDEGMFYGDVANEFFDPMAVIDGVALAAERYGHDPYIYYEMFMNTPGSWMIQLDQTYEPEILEAESYSPAD
ncbi:MAG: CotH kinase family protein [Clostridia bacterium]|nr:CotH kinase family protein [Clostridia bacterium]